MSKHEAVTGKGWKNSVSSMSFCFFMVLLGIPLWWKTTEVYRVSLPYESIEEISKSGDFVVPNFELTIVVFDDSFLHFSQESGLLSANLRRRLAVVSEIKYEKIKRENESYLTGVDSSFSSLDDAFSSLIGDTKALSVFVLPAELNKKLCVNGQSMFVGKHRSLYLCASLSSYVKLYADAIADFITGEEMEKRRDLHPGLPADKQKKPKRVKKEFVLSDMHPNYNLDVYIVNPDPALCRAFVNTDVFVNQYMSSFMRHLAPISNISVSVQSLYYVPLSSRKQQNGVSSVMSPASLQESINYIEHFTRTELASDVPVINLVVYVPTTTQYPLHLVDDDGEATPENSAIVADWGGLLVYNPAEPCSGTVEITARHLAQSVVTQLRSIFHLDALRPRIPGVEYSTAPLTRWEVDQLRLRSYVAKRDAVSGTLRSLDELLGSIGNIVINDEVGSAIQSAVSEFTMAETKMRGGDDLAAFRHMLEAHRHTERAFYDPSLLALLYFPEDQKYAIYIPLFLPVGIPVLMSLLAMLKRIQKRNKEALEI